MENADNHNNMYKFRSINSSLLLCSHMWFNIRYICAWRCCYWLVFDIKWCVCVSSYGGFARCAKIYPALSYMCDIYFLLECVSLASLCPMCIFLLCLHWLYVNFGDLVNMEVQSRSCLDSFWCWCVHSLSLRVRLFLLTRSH